MAVVVKAPDLVGREAAELGERELRRLGGAEPFDAVGGERPELCPR